MCNDAEHRSQKHLEIRKHTIVKAKTFFVRKLSMYFSYFVSNKNMPTLSTYDLEGLACKPNLLRSEIRF